MLDLICEDCALWAANRDDSSAGNWQGHAEAALYCLDAEAEVEDFSPTPCAACGTRLAGARFPAYELGA